MAIFYISILDLTRAPSSRVSAAAETENFVEISQKLRHQRPTSLSSL